MHALSLSLFLALSLFIEPLRLLVSAVRSWGLQFESLRQLCGRHDQRESGSGYEGR